MGNDAQYDKELEVEAEKIGDRIENGEFANVDELDTAMRVSVLEAKYRAS